MIKFCFRKMPILSGGKITHKPGWVLLLVLTTLVGSCPKVTLDINKLQYLDFTGGKVEKKKKKKKRNLIFAET